MPDLTTRSLRGTVNPEATAKPIATERDKFFYVNDATEKATETARDPIVLGPGRLISRTDVISGRVKIVEALNGERPIDAEDLEPVDHNLTHLDNHNVPREHREHILMVSRKTVALAGTRVAAFIRRCEELHVETEFKNVFFNRTEFSRNRVRYKLSHKAR